MGFGVMLGALEPTLVMDNNPFELKVYREWAGKVLPPSTYHLEPRASGNVVRLDLPPANPTADSAAAPAITGAEFLSENNQGYVLLNPGAAWPTTMAG